MQKVFLVVGVVLVVLYLAFLSPFSTLLPAQASTSLFSTSSHTWVVSVAGHQYQVRVGQHEETIETNATAPPIAPDMSRLGSTERVAWALDFLKSIGNEAPTIETVAFVVAWQAGENTTAAFNPLATTQTMYPQPENPCFNSLPSMPCGVKNYVSREQGLEANIITVQNGYYPNLLAGLQMNDPGRALDAAELATWGTGLGNVQTNYTRILADLAAPDVRQQLVSYALSLQGLPYVYGGRSTSGADCSGTMQLVYLTIIGQDIGATTFSQFPALEPIELEDVQPGDLWYGQYTDDQHTGMVADVNGDGKWDLINNGGLESSMHVDYDFLSLPYFTEHTMGFRRAL